MVMVRVKFMVRVMVMVRVKVRVRVRVIGFLLDEMFDHAEHEKGLDEWRELRLGFG